MSRERTDIPGVYKRQTAAGVRYDIAVAQGSKRVWRTFSSKDAASKAKTKLQNERNMGRSITTDNITVKAYLEEWLEDRKPSLGATTYTSYSINLKRHVIAHVGSKKLKDLSHDDIRKCYRTITDTRSAKTALNVHRVLSQALKAAVRAERLPRNICDTVDAPKPAKYRVTPPSLKTLEGVLKMTDDTLYATVTRLALFTGLRLGELLGRPMMVNERWAPNPNYGLHWEDIDLDRGILRVREAKHDSAGTVILPPGAVELLKAHKESQAELFKKLGASAPQHGLVFTNSVGKQMDQGGLKRFWKKVKAAHGIRFHDLRHSHASLLIAGGVHAKVIQERLRHKQITTTLDTYGHLMGDLQQDAALTIENAMKGISPSKEKPKRGGPA